jgi:hypothetical protein
MNDRRLLCEEFDFAALRSQGRSIQERISVVDEKRGSALEG